MGNSMVILGTHLKHSCSNPMFGPALLATFEGIGDASHVTIALLVNFDLGRKKKKEVKLEPGVFLYACLLNLSGQLSDR